MNRLVLLEHLVDYVPKEKYTYFLVKSNFPGFNDEKRDLAYDIIEDETETNETVIENDYLIPLIDCSDKEMRQICKDVIPSAFTKKEFPRYFCKIKTGENPVLVELNFPKREGITMPLLPYGSVSYDVISLDKIKGYDSDIGEVIEALKSEKKEVKNMFYAS